MEKIFSTQVGNIRIEYFVDDDGVVIIRQRRGRSGWYSEGRQIVDTSVLREIRDVLVKTKNYDILQKLINTLSGQ